jgi:hypothetical protein
MKEIIENWWLEAFDRNEALDGLGARGGTRVHAVIFRRNEKANPASVSPVCQTRRAPRHPKGGHELYVGLE